MSKIIIVISGKKGSGKDTFANMLAASMYNLLKGAPGGPSMLVRPDGKLWWQPENGSAFREIVLRGPGSEPHVEVAGVKILAFADYLKQMCMDLFGLTYEQCYGSNADKETLTNVEWENFPLWVRLRYAGAKWYKPWTWSPMFGRMTARAVQQVVGTEVVRQIMPNAWADALYRTAIRVPQDVVIVPDCRFPNEYDRKKVAEDEGCNVITVRLLRNVHPDDKHPSETSLDDIDLSTMDLVLAPDETLETMKWTADNFAESWLELMGLIPFNPRKVKVA